LFFLYSSAGGCVLKRSGLRRSRLRYVFALYFYLLQILKNNFAIVMVMGVR